MKTFAAQYKHYGIGESLPDYWHTFRAITEQDARKEAEKYKRKNYHLIEPLIEDKFPKHRY